MINLKIKHYDSGFCRVVYKSDAGQEFCFQDDTTFGRPAIQFLDMCNGEPNCPINIKHLGAVEYPAAVDQFTAMLRSYLMGLNLGYTAKKEAA